MRPEIEQQILSQLKWRSVAEIPHCPAASLQELRSKVASGDLFVAVNFTAANQLAHSIFGAWNSLVAGLISWIPFLTAFAILPAAFVLKSFWVLAGVPLALFAMLFANPINPARGLATATALLSTAAAAWLGLKGTTAQAIVAAAYMLPFWAIRYLYFRNARRLTSEALASEPLFLYLLQNGHMFIRNTKSGEQFWARAE